MVAGVLVGIWVTRYLGPQEFGLLSFAIAFSAFFTGFARLGLDGILVRELSLKPSLSRVYMGTAFWLKITAAIFTLAILSIILLSMIDDYTVKLYILIISSGVIFQAFDVIDFYFQSKVLSSYIAICKIFQLVLSSLIKIYLIFVQAELVWFVMVSLIDQISLAISLYLIYRSKKIGRFFSYFDLLIAMKLLKESWPYILSGLVVMAYMRVDQIMIKEMLGDREVGLYSAAVRLCEAWYFMPILITNLLFPSIITAKKISENFYYERIQVIYRILIWLALLIAIPMTFLSDWLIRILYGDEFKGAGLVLAINIWAGIFIFFGCAWSKWMLIEGRNKMSAFFQINALLWNVGLNIILIPKFGIYGAALATLIAASIGHIVLPIFIKSQRIALIMFIKSFWPKLI